MPNNILSGQKITNQKRELSKQLRSNMTPAENRLWQAVRRSQIDGFHFRRQQIIDGLIADFYCHAIGLVIELDGPIHQQQQEYDHERDAILKRRGLTVLRLPNQEIMTNLTGCLQRIRELCHLLAKTNILK